MTLTPDSAVAVAPPAETPTPAPTTADLVSLLNGAVGLAVMWAATAVRSGNQVGLARIGIMLLICVICDLLDGVLARCRGASRWGATLDSAGARAVSAGRPR